MNPELAPRAGARVRWGLPDVLLAWFIGAAASVILALPFYDSDVSADHQPIRLYLATHEGDLVAATTMVRVGGHAWYSYGASSSSKRDVRGSNAIQWRMLRDARAAGADVYDLRGITNTLDESDAHFGLIQFKLGTGGEAVEYLGEWDLPLNRLLFKAFELYLSRR